MEENVGANDFQEVPNSELPVENVEEEEKLQLKLEVLEDTATSQQPIYQMRPQLHEKYFNLIIFIIYAIKLYFFLISFK